jgi:hypothetical protein
MNVSQEHLAVLLLAKHSGERFFSDLFGKLGFYFKDEPLSQKNFFMYPHNFGDYEKYLKITCIDNPYNIIYEEFLKNSNTNWKLKTNTIEKQQEEFSYWFDLIFYNEVDYLEGNCSGHALIFLFCRDFFKLDIDYVVKRESYFEDLQKIPFVDVSKINKNLLFLLETKKDHQNVINKEQAKKIFDFYKPYFEKFGFDPFSFTSQELSLKEKVDFIHS